MDAWNEKQTRVEELLPLILEQLAAGQTVRFAPYGVSMLPMLRQGVDTVVLSPVPGKLKKYDLPLYRRDNGKFVLHRIVKAGKTYTCIGDNQYVLEFGIRQDQLLALVTGFYRGDRYHSVRSPGYRCYCVVWHLSRPIRHFAQRVFGYIRRKIHRKK